MHPSMQSQGSIQEFFIYLFIFLLRSGNGETMHLLFYCHFCYKNNVIKVVVVALLFLVVVFFFGGGGGGGGRLGIPSPFPSVHVPEKPSVAVL